MNTAPLDKAQTLIDLGRYEQALEILITCNDQDVHIPEKRRMIIVCHLELDAPEKAKELCLSALQQFPDYSIFHYLLAFYYRKKEQYTKAVEHAKIAFDQEPEFVPYINYLGLLMIDAERYHSAKSYLELAQEHDPNNVETLSYLALLEIKQQNELAALEYIKRGIEIDPNNLYLHNLRNALSTRSKSEAKKAKEHALHTLSLDPTDQFAKSTLLEILKAENSLFGFFLRRSFGRFQIEWNIGRIIMLIFFFKGMVVWAGFMALFLLVTWWGGVLFNSIIRVHKRYKYLLDPPSIQQSNIFLVMNGLLLTAICIASLTAFDSEIKFGMIASIASLLLFTISYHEIDTKGGKLQFWVYGAFVGIVQSFLLANNHIWGFGIFSIIFIMAYALLFSLSVLFE